MTTDKKLGWLQLGLVSTFVIVALGISQWLKYAQNTELEQTPDVQKVVVDTVTLRTTKHKVAFDTTGIVRAKAIVTAVPQVSGRVIQVSDAFYAGGRFAADEVLFAIEQRDYEVALNAAQADYAQALSLYEVEEARADVALADWQRTNPGKKAPALALRIPQLAEAKQRMEAAKSAKENAAIQLERTLFKFPFNGVVLSADLDEGQFVSAGQVYGRVYDADGLEIETKLSRQQWQWLQASGKASAKVTGADSELTVPLRLVRSAAEVNEKTRFVTVRFLVADSTAKLPAQLIPGTVVSLEVAGPVLQGVFVAPVASVQADGAIRLVNSDKELEELNPYIITRNDGVIVFKPQSDDLVGKKEITVVTSRISDVPKGAAVVVNESGS